MLSISPKGIGFYIKYINSPTSCPIGSPRLIATNHVGAFSQVIFQLNPLIGRKHPTWLDGTRVVLVHIHFLHLKNVKNRAKDGSSVTHGFQL